LKTPGCLPPGKLSPLISPPGVFPTPLEDRLKTFLKPRGPGDYGPGPKKKTPFRNTSRGTPLWKRPGIPKFPPGKRGGTPRGDPVSPKRRYPPWAPPGAPINPRAPLKLPFGKRLRMEHHAKVNPLGPPRGPSRLGERRKTPITGGVPKGPVKPEGVFPNLECRKGGNLGKGSPFNPPLGGGRAQTLPGPQIFSQSPCSPNLPWVFKTTAPGAPGVPSKWGPKSPPGEPKKVFFKPLGCGFGPQNFPKETCQRPVNPGFLEIGFGKPPGIPRPKGKGKGLVPTQKPQFGAARTLTLGRLKPKGPSFFFPPGEALNLNSTWGPKWAKVNPQIGNPWNR